MIKSSLIRRKIWFDGFWLRKFFRLQLLCYNFSLQPLCYHF